MPLGSQGCPLLHESSESFPRQLGRDGLVLQVVRRIRKIIRDFLPGIVNPYIVRSGSFLWCLVSTQPYLSLLRCGSDLRYPLVQFRPVSHASERRRRVSSASSSSSSSTSSTSSFSTSSVTLVAPEMSGLAMLLTMTSSS